MLAIKPISRADVLVSVVMVASNLGAYMNAAHTSHDRRHCDLTPAAHGGRILDRMLQLHGCNGYSREYEVERLDCDDRVMRIFEGTIEIQHEVIVRTLLGRADHTD
ncbi:MAG: acyl-CoA/acyl-ACP dehydrogenase [Marinibacterium sp.]|nr:acyl-CoA/acyl-ACP dehydrogenase [Marinibacterium sp.]